MNAYQALQILSVELEISLAELARTIGIHNQYFSIIKSGKIKVLSQKIQNSIREKYGHELVIEYSFRHPSHTIKTNTLWECLYDLQKYLHITDEELCETMKCRKQQLDRINCDITKTIYPAYAKNIEAKYGFVFERNFVFVKVGESFRNKVENH
jgi:ASC-1-like (ASCH) protein